MNATSESYKTRKIFISHQFTFYEQLKFHAQFSIKKSFITWGPGPNVIIVILNSHEPEISSGHKFKMYFEIYNQKNRIFLAEQDNCVNIWELISQ